MKAELLDWPASLARAAAEKAIFEWVEGWCNTHRRYSTLDYLGPAAHEATADTTAPAFNVA